MRPRLAPGFTLVADAEAVWLVAGEDVRYRLAPGGDPAWLATVLRRCDGSRALDAIVAEVPADRRADACDAITGLYEERVLVDGTPEQAHVASVGVRVVGDSPLAELVRSAVTGGDAIDVLVQDTLDHAALLRHNTDALAARRRWMWISAGAASRAYIGPLFVPGAGPCAACLLVHFKRLSPAPALYDALLDHAGTFARVELSPGFERAIAAHAAWKLELAARPIAHAALYALHVLEDADRTVTSHVPIADPECAACRA